MIIRVIVVRIEENVTKTRGHKTFRKNLEGREIGRQEHTTDEKDSLGSRVIIINKI